MTAPTLAGVSPAATTPDTIPAPLAAPPLEAYAVPPRAPARGAVVRALTRRMGRFVEARIVLPDGSVIGPSRPDLPVLRIHSWAFFDRVGIDAKIGVGEGFMAGEWSPGPGTDLADLLTPFAARLAELVPAPLARLRRLAEPRHPGHHRGERVHAAANIAHHYDLQPDFFALFLDPTLTYSAARFAPGDPAGVEGLEIAQRRKIDAILDDARVGPGTHVLEIGTGWGQLAIQAAQRGASVETITLSHSQRDVAVQRIAAAGLSDRVAVDVRDYRDITGTYDAVVSVEMIEAVGYEFWGDYFTALARATRPGGVVALQAITMPHERMLASRHAFGWIQKHIFPGGLIPSPEAITQHARAAGLVPASRRSLRDDYASTLRVWRERFVGRREEVLALGFDPVFLRLWEFYLAYSEAGFRSGHLDVLQLGLYRAG